MPNDWTHDPITDHPASLGWVLNGSHLIAIDNDRVQRSVTIRFSLPPDAGPPEAVFLIERTTHLLTFVYLPPAIPVSDGLTPEEAMATLGEWARQGLIATADPLTFETSLVVERAFLHTTEEGSTLRVEGYGENADRLVWWEVRVSGSSVEAA